MTRLQLFTDRRPNVRMIPSLLLLSLAAACSDAGATAQPAPVESTPTESDAGASSPAASLASNPGQQPIPVAKQHEVTPNRFDPGGEISDADLAKYFVEWTCSVDGKDVGTMSFSLWSGETPITSRNFLRLCDSGFYDGISIHRIVRNFMVQGGDPTGTGGGNSPYGTIKAEFSTEPQRAHGYGVLSMARFGNDDDSASSQFFLCCDESPSVWGLDGKYASFGKMTKGVATLEALADVPTTRSRSGEKSKPLKTVLISKAVVKEGTAPDGDKIARPTKALDLKGEPEAITVQHILISFKDRLPGVTRSKEEAEALANEVLERVRGGESMDDLAREHSDDPIEESDTTPGHYSLLNNGVRDVANERFMFNLQREFRATMQEMQDKVKAGTMTQDDFNAKLTEVQKAAQAKAQANTVYKRSGMVPAFGNVGFKLKVGDVGLAPHDAKDSRYGYHIIKRVK